MDEGGLAVAWQGRVCLTTLSGTVKSNLSPLDLLVWCALAIFVSSVTPRVKIDNQAYCYRVLAHRNVHHLGSERHTLF